MTDQIENNNLETTQLEATENNTEATKVESTGNNPKESEGGDDSRTKTAIKIVMVLLPAIIIQSLTQTISTIDKDIVALLFNIYNVVFQIGLTGLVAYAVYESVNFVFDKEEQPNTNQLMMILMMVLAIVPFSIYGLNLLGINPLQLDFIPSPKTLYLIILVAVLAYTATKGIDIKDIFVNLFMVTIFLMYAASLNTAINGWGLLGIVLVLGIAIVSDTMAYIGGKKYGNRQAFPEVSPNKTVEGLLAGFLSALAFGFVIFAMVLLLDGSMPGELDKHLFGSLVANPNMAAAIIVGALVSPFGDLTFSKIKRSYDKKDYSNILPGHGGLFDRLDSHIFVTIVMVAIY